MYDKLAGQVNREFSEFEVAQPGLRDEMRHFVKSGNVKYVNAEDAASTLTARDSAGSGPRADSARRRHQRASKLGDTVYF